MAMIGGSYLPWAVGTRKLNAERLAQVRARIAAIPPGQNTEPPEHALTELRAIEHEKPSYVLPIAFLAAGTVPLIGGVATYAALRPGSSAEQLALSIGLVVVGLAAEGLGAGLLLTRIRTRMEIDETLRALEPPSDDGTSAPQAPPQGTSLPPLPAQLAFGWHF
jgi:hypothetical protein